MKTCHWSVNWFCFCYNWSFFSSWFHIFPVLAQAVNCLQSREFLCFSQFQSQIFLYIKSQPHISYYFWVLLIGMCSLKYTPLLSAVGTKNFWLSKFQKKAFFHGILNDRRSLCKELTVNFYGPTVSVKVVEHKIIINAVVHSWHKKYCLV